MSFVDLSIDRDKIDEQIRLLGVNIEGPTNLTNNVTKYVVSKAEDPKNKAILNIYSKDALTSISLQGKNEELGKEVAQHIVNTCSVGSRKPANLSFNKVSDEKFTLIKEYLTEECEATLTHQNVQHGIKYVFVGRNGDTINITHFNTKTLTIQGTQQFLYIDVIEVLSDVLDYKEVIKQQVKTIIVANTVEETLGEFQQVFPNSYKYLGNTLTSIMSPTLVFRKMDIDLTDYSSLVFPLLKGMEGFLKKILQEYLIEVNKEGFRELFEYVSIDNYKLIDEHRNTIGNGKIVKSIEDIYQYYKRHRHGLFHVDSQTESSRIIESKAEANEIINYVINIIEVSYLTITKENNKIGKGI